MDALLKRFAEIEAGTENSFLIRGKDDITELPYIPKGTEEIYLCAGVEIKKLPPLPKGLKVLHICRTQIEELPEKLPESLVSLTVSWLKITKLPKLPKGLKALITEGMVFDALPEFPPKLEHLEITFTEVKELPELPDSLRTFLDDGSYFGIIRKPGERIKAYNKRLQERYSMERIQQRCLDLKEEIMMAALHPDRVSAWAEAGAWEMFD